MKGNQFKSLDFVSGPRVSSPDSNECDPSAQTNGLSSCSGIENTGPRGRTRRHGVLLSLGRGHVENPSLGRDTYKVRKVRTLPTQHLKF